MDNKSETQHAIEQAVKTYLDEWQWLPIAKEVLYEMAGVIGDCIYNEINGRQKPEES